MRLPAGLPGPARSSLESVLERLPHLEGRAIRVRFLPSLKAHRGRLLHGVGHGVPVHAASFLRRRVLVLETELLARPRELARIFAHELSHFLWPRLGRAARAGYESLLAREMRRGARGELGWSSERRKQRIAPGDTAQRSRRWRQYVCESFCDSAAWMLAGGRHAEFTLTARARAARRRWLEKLFAGREFFI